MKTTTIVLALVSLGVNTLSAQVAQTKPATADVTDGAAQYKEVERDAHSRVWARVSNETNKLGEVTTSTNSYTELATGLHYRAGDNWLASEAKIEILPNNAGAAASKGQHKAIFPPEIKSGIIELQMPDNQWLRSRVWGIAYFDSGTGDSVLLAEVKKSEGQVVGDNVVIYPDAFTDFSADIRYTFTIAGFEQDVVLRQQPPSPEKFGMNPKTTRLQVLTEFVEAPSPAKEIRQAGGLADQSLGFGAMSIGSGKAFSVDAVGDTTGQVPVAKEWTPLDGRDFLIEEVHYEKVAEQLQKLPASTEYKGASLQRRGSGTNVIAGLKKIMPKRYAKVMPKPGTKRMAQAKPSSAPGFVMDYFTLISAPDVTLKGDTTYYVSSVVNLSGTTTIDGGTVVKFASGTAPKINITGTVDCRTSMYRPAVFTSKDDNTVGDAFGTGNPGSVKYGSGLIFSTSGMALNYLRFSYANSAVTLNFGSGHISMTNMQFMNCLYPIDFGNSDDTVFADNSLFYSITSVTTGGYSTYLRGNHLTINQCLEFDGSGNSLGRIYLTNSLVANVSSLGYAEEFDGSHNGFFNSPTFGYSLIPPPPAGASPFHSLVSAASHYLADDSYRNKGTTELPPSLLANLKLRTTHPPTVVSGNITVATEWSRRPIRDTDDHPALGYHYDPLDYVVNAKTVTANLTLSGGVALGTYGAFSSFGLGLSSGNFISEGTPTRLNWIVRYNTVQEQSTTTWSVNNTTWVAPGVRKLSSSPTVNVRFTGWSVLGGTAEHFLDEIGNNTVSSFSDCQFSSGKFNVNPSAIGLINYATFNNCLWERVWVDLKDMDGDPHWSLYNNLFYGGKLAYRAAGNNPILLAYDNLFDKTSITKGGGSIFFTHGNNGYVSATYLGGTSSGGDKDITWPAGYQDGPLGKYYYNTGGNLNVLINADNTRDPANVGLYHYTVKKAENTREGTDSPANLDIGFHYVAVDGNGNPVDGDNDGLADYLEDTNGNGSYGTGDLADLGATDTDGDGMSDGWEWYNFGDFTRNGSGDYDGDGYSDLAEFTAHSDPNTIQFYTLFDNLRVNGNSLTGTVTVLAGVPAKIAVQSTTNFASASWRTYNASFIANIGTSDGAYPVYVGLKGMADTSEVTWAGYHVTRDTTAPLMVITNPLAGIVFQPMLQLQGYSPEPLASVRYDITNANGSLTNLEGYVVKQFVDTNTLAITTNWFACVDLNLAAGTNTVTLKATDRAGNVTTTNLHYVFVYPTNAPVLSLVWPQDGDLLSGTSFTVRGRLSDPTAKVTAEVVGDGETHSMTGIVERDGKFWIENVPLAAGANEVTISVVDAGTNSSGTNFTVVKSGVALTIDPLNSSELNNPYITVYGSINVSTHKIWVNGMEVTNVSSGTWYVEGVPLNEGGTAVVQARAIPLTDNGGNGTGGGSGGAGQNTTFDDPGNPDSPTDITTEADADKQAEVVMIHYEKNRSYLSLTRDEYPTKKQTKEIIKWDVKQPGSWFNDDCDGNTFGSHMYYVCNSRNWERNGIGTLKSWEDRGGEEVCGVQLYGAPTPYTLEAAWQGEYCGTTGYRVIAGGGIAMDQVVARTARTLYELHTGGKKLSGRKNLFVLSSGAEGVGNAFWPEEDDDKRSYVVANTSVVLGDVGRLDSDGKIYPVLPDGQTRDVTPRVDGNPYYTFGEPGHSKHGLQLVSPSGNPTNAPSDPDRLCYTEALPGVLTVQFHAVLTNNGPAWAVTNRVRFEADAIPGSTQSWNADNPGGRPTASGSDLNATLYYTTLPTNNSDFGIKFARVKLDGEVQDQKCFWAFYPADAYNYPGCSGPPYDAENPVVGMWFTPPNYFYYYMQTPAKYGSPYFDYRGSWETRPAEYPTSLPPYPYYVEARLSRTGYPVLYGNNAGKNYKYINVFAYACRHEATHCIYFNQWWPNGWVSTNDVDQPQPDSIPSTIEPALGFDPTLTATHPQPQGVSPWDDDQDYTLQHEPIWGAEDVKSANKEDWAHPGAQYP